MLTLRTAVLMVVVCMGHCSSIHHRARRQSGTPVWQCNFENNAWGDPTDVNGCGTGFQGMTQEVTGGFLRTNAATPSGHTGPQGPGSDGGYYIFIESSGDAADRRNVIISIVTPQLPEGFKTMSFNYHSRGSSVGSGSLTVTPLDASQGDISWETTPTFDLTSNNAWRRGPSSNEFSLPTGTRFVRFAFQLPDTDNFWSADYALDDIRVLSSDPCIVQPCQNGGTCAVVGETYECSCDSGWIGRNCDREDTGGSGVDVVFLLDSTGSVGGPSNTADNFNRQKNWVKSVLGNLDVGGKDRISLIRWASQGDLMFDFNDNTNINALNSAIDAVNYVGGPSVSTDVSSGLTRAQTLFADTENNGGRSGAPDAIVLVTNGVSKRNKGLEYTTAIALKAVGVKIMVITVAESDEMARLLPQMASQIASAPVGDNWRQITSFSALSNVVSFTSSSVTNVADDCATVSCGSGTCVDLIGGYQCDCPSDRYGVTCEGRKSDVRSQQADITFILDRSGSVGADNYGGQLRTIERTVYDLYRWFGSGNIRVSIVSFGSDSRVEFALDRFTNSIDMLAAINALEYTGGSSNIWGGLNKARTQVFAQGGSSSGTRKFAVLFADGAGKGNDPREEATLLKNSGVNLLTVGLGDNVDEDELRQMASYPSSDNYVKQGHGFSTAVESFIVGRTIDSTDSCSPNPCQNGGVCTDLPGTAYTCSCPSGRGGVNCQFSCNVNYDVILGIDRSGSLGNDFMAELSFARQVAEIFPYLNGATRLGVFSYAGDNEIQTAMNLVDGTSLAIERSSIMSIAYTGGSTHLTAATQKAIDMFQSNLGDRSSAANKFILLTDGFNKKDKNNLATVANNLRNSNGPNAEVFVVGFTNEINKEELDTIAGTPDNVILVESFDETLFPAAIASLQTKLCT